MSDAVIERECAEHIHWHPYITVEKYSAEQTSWAEGKLASAVSWRRFPVLKHIPLGERDGAPVATLQRHQGSGMVHNLHGSWLRELFPGGPEDGYAHDDGNLLTNQGLTNILYLLTAVAGAPANANIPTATAATTADTVLGANGGSAWYQGSDATFPSLTTPATVNNQCTFASANGNFAWNEWCWVAGTGTLTAGATLSSSISNSCMMNHKVPASSLGTKASGASWVFSSTLVFSL